MLRKCERVLDEINITVLWCIMNFFVIAPQVHLPVSLTVSGIPPLYSCTCHNVEMILKVCICIWNVLCSVISEMASAVAVCS